MDHNIRLVVNINVYLGAKILVENFSKFVLVIIKGKNFFFFCFFFILNLFLHVLVHFETIRRKKFWVHKNRVGGGGLCKSVTRTQPT